MSLFYSPDSLISPYSLPSHFPLPPPANSFSPSFLLQIYYRIKPFSDSCKIVLFSKAYKILQMPVNPMQSHAEPCKSHTKRLLPQPIHFLPLAHSPGQFPSFSPARPPKPWRSAQAAGIASPTQTVLTCFPGTRHFLRMLETHCLDPHGYLSCSPRFPALKTALVLRR